MSTQTLPNTTVARRMPPRPAAGVGTSAPGLTAKDIAGILRRRVWMIVIVTIISTLLAGVLWYVLRRTSARYTSDGLILVKMPMQPDLLGGQTMLRADVIEQEMQTRSLFLKNQRFLSGVLQRVKVQQTAWFKSYREPAARTKALQKGFSASPQRNSQYIRVAMTTSSARESQEILNEILNQFQQVMYKEATGRLTRSKEALLKKKFQVQTLLTAGREKLFQLAASADLPGWEERNNIVAQEHVNLHGQKLALEAAQNETQIRIFQVQNEERQRGVSSEVQTGVEADPQMRTLKQRLTQHVEYRDRLLDRFGEEHREVTEIQRSIESVEELIAARKGELEFRYSRLQLSQLNQTRQAINAQLLEVTDAYAEISAEQSRLDELRRKYKITQEENTSHKRAMDRLEVEIDKLTVSIQNPDRVRAEIAAEAMLPLFISFPKLSMFLPAGIFLGLVFSIGLAVLLEFLDDSVKTPSDVARHLHLPLLGMIPYHESESEGEDKDEFRVEVIAHHRSRAVMSEYYRQLRTNLQFSAPGGELKVIFVTSCAAGCGKTATATNLAITFAAGGKRVLLVDGNFRRPTLAAVFKDSVKPMGLSNVLIGNCSADDAICPTRIENLDLLPSGPTPPNPGYLLGGRLMQELIDEQKKKYDYVLLDGPPALVVSEARILASLADGTIVVVRAGKTSRGIANRMFREMKGPNVRFLGVLLNAVRARRGGYFAKHFQSYYEYIGEDPPQGGVPVGAMAGYDIAERDSASSADSRGGEDSHRQA